ncbi:MAG: hypothetical protein RI947_434 [Candidatus Parcubacteria bacterium]|jgi:LPXTG-site transpeptidase (sortase) family protein
MKKLLLFLTACTAAGVLFIKLSYPQLPSQQVQQVPSSLPSSTIPPQQSEVLSVVNPTIPTHISIPAIGVDAVVESVGLDEQGKMDVPQKNENVAWYNLGYKPGEQGSAVMAGHFDTVTGAPAVFYNLSKLKKGDTITVTDLNGEKYTYTVSQTIIYPYNKLPLKQIFASNNSFTLNLITCEGTFNQTTRNYSDRTVVSADLVR